MTATLTDPITWMHEQIKAVIPDAGPFVPSDIAVKLAERLQHDEPEMFTEWLRAVAVVTLTDRVGQLLRSERTRARNAAPRGAFAEWSTRVGTETETPSPYQWDCKRPVNDAHEWKYEWQFTRDDATFIASEYGATGRAALMEEAFYKAVAKRLTGSKTVADVFDRDTYQAMRDSVCKA